MTDIENSKPLDESEDDIYKDILEFNLEDELAELEGNKETSKQEANDLHEKVRELTEENKELKKSNEVLKKNLSTLLKTAQAEVQRKDSMIKDLRIEIESFTFRRNKNLTKDQYTSTEDLEPKSEEKYKSEKQKIVDDKKRSKSYKNWTGNDNERKSNQEQKKKEHLFEKQENFNCDNNSRKSDYYRENSKTNYRHSEGCHDTYNDRNRERKSTRHEHSLGYRKSYRENYRDHLKYDSFDKKRHSRSSDSRFISYRENSRKRKEDYSRSESSDRRRRRRSSETTERFNNSRQNRMSSNRFSDSRSGTTLPESDLEEGELPDTQTNNECRGTSVSPPEEDWTLSFKNERKNETKSMTLYSQRMMRKFSSETKISEKLENKEEKSLEEDNRKETESKKLKKIKETEKEPGDSEHILDFYNGRLPLIRISEQSAQTSLREKTASEKEQEKIYENSEEKDSLKNSSSEKDFETELKIILPSVGESPIKQEKKPKKREEKEFNNNKEKTEVKKPKVSKKDNVERKRQHVPKKKSEKSTPKNNDQKRKRKFSETQEENSDIKKRKTEKNEPFRKSTRRKGNSKNDNDCKIKSETESEAVRGEKPELENKIKEDISSFEFFKPVAKAENPLIPVNVEKVVSKTTDYKMTAMMSVSGVVRLETPNKCLEKLNNLIINEQMIFNVLDSKNNSQFSPLIGSKCMEMTPRKMLKNDLMLTDSEDDSVNKRNLEGCEDEVEQEEVEEEEEGEILGSENSECDSDSGASNFVDLL